MASPQTEHGFVKIAQELLIALTLAKLSGTEYQILLAVIRQTYGWHKKTDWISYTQLEKMTDRGRRSVSKALAKLVNKSILVKKPTLGKRNLLGLNKDWEQWTQLGNKRALVNKRVLTRALLGFGLGNKSTTTKDTITQDIIQKGFFRDKGLEDYPVGGGK